MKFDVGNRIPNRTSGNNCFFVLNYISGLTIEAIDQLQHGGLTVSSKALNQLLKVEESRCLAAAELIKKSTEQQLDIDVEELKRTPHIHLGETNYPTQIVDNGKFINLNSQLDWNIISVRHSHV